MKVRIDFDQRPETWTEIVKALTNVKADFDESRRKNMEARYPRIRDHRILDKLGFKKVQSVRDQVKNKILNMLLYNFEFEEMKEAEINYFLVTIEAQGLKPLRIIQSFKKVSQVFESCKIYEVIE